MQLVLATSCIVSTKRRIIFSAPSTSKTPHNMTTRLHMLAEQLKISILERNRLLALGMKPSDDDEAELRRSLTTLQSGIESLTGASSRKYRTDAHQDELIVLREQYNELRGLYSDCDHDDLQLESSGPSSSYAFQPYHDNPFEADPSEVLPDRSRKSVRFKDAAADSNVNERDILQLQTQIIREQDSSLDNLSQSIGRQRELSIQIGDELDEHGELIDDVGGMVDHTTNRLDHARSNLTQFSRKTRENSHLLTIIILIVILVILLVTL